MELNSFDDWEEWARLARENPEKFEEERAAAVEKLIMSQPPASRHRSRQLQWKIDAIRRTSPNSMAACLRIYDMLLDRVYGPDGLVEVFRSLTGENPGFEELQSGKKARILEFSPDRSEKGKRSVS